jgi:hypothetical protein
VSQASVLLWIYSVSVFSIGDPKPKFRIRFSKKPRPNPTVGMLAATFLWLSNNSTPGPRGLDYIRIIKILYSKKTGVREKYKSCSIDPHTKSLYPLSVCAACSAFSLHFPVLGKMRRKNCSDKRKNCCATLNPR